MILKGNITREDGSRTKEAEFPIISIYFMTRFFPENAQEYTFNVSFKIKQFVSNNLYSNNQIMQRQRLKGGLYAKTQLKRVFIMINKYPVKKLKCQKGTK